MLSEDFLLRNSGLPGPRANLALLHRFMREGDAATAAECLKYAAPGVANSPEEFAAMCGVAATGWHKRGDKRGALAFLRPYASHSSWRVRESVAIAVQELSEASMAETVTLLAEWADGPLESRAAVAAVCEPRLLKHGDLARPVFELLNRATAPFDTDAKLSEAQEVLRKALGYGWSVAVAAFPDLGRMEFGKLFFLKGKHVAWILRENLKKDRLRKMDAAWVEACSARLPS